MLQKIDRHYYKMDGMVTFNNATEIAQQGKKLLLQDFQLNQIKKTITLSLKDLTIGDSATLSVCLEWMRLALKYKIKLEIIDIPNQIISLVEITDMSSVFI